ncbi:MAG: tyrosine recombinase XerC [Oscillospiraceae bacterium]|nr:tyrosine recombinase XerC [Oscillospiraceae bacterium]
MDYRQDAPEVLCQFLTYHEAVKDHSAKTIDEYYLDLRSFFRYLKRQRDPSLKSVPFDSISILDIDIDFLRTVTLTDVYNYMSYLTRERHLESASRARKLSTIRSFFKYLTSKVHLLEENPVKDMDSVRRKRNLPRYLDLDSSIRLLESVEGPNQTRDYCILTLFLNCGLRISELVGLNMNDVQKDRLHVLGKGGKERIVFLNDACTAALDDYIAERSAMTLIDENALFVTRRRTRITVSAVHKLVKKHLLAAGLDAEHLSSHKLRHTAATLMLQNGVDVRTLQEVLGHENLNTTQIYTHVDNDELRVAARANPLAKVRKKD